MLLWGVTKATICGVSKKDMLEVIIGMGLTTLALLGMLRKSFIGDKIGAQKYMQWVSHDLSEFVSTNQLTSESEVDILLNFSLKVEKF